MVIIMQINDKLETQKLNLFRKRIFDEKLICDLEDIKWFILIKLVLVKSA